MANDLKASVQRGDDLGLAEEELAFYDALSQNKSAVEVLGNEELRKIAHVLVEQLRCLSNKLSAGFMQRL
jgi:type I restriction enzyme R subunit